MNILSDSHTHCAESLNGIIALEPREARFMPGKVYSIGIHPWKSLEATEEDLMALDELAVHPQVLAIGETGLDRLRGGDLNLQTALFKHHILLSESINKPLIIHNVRCVPELISLRKKLKATQPWIFHGYRGNAETAKQLCNAGIMLSFGERFTPGVPQSVPADMILIETDMSRIAIEEIAKRISPDDPDLPGRNLRRVFPVMKIK
ncbi:MAG: TatD family hydrolase [Paramuribaculum sp.]|nr:TatD family hydrolase [Paramuribaculum sp.]